MAERGREGRGGVVGWADAKFLISQGQSQTMATLKGLVQKGVKVDLGIPLELWDEPSVEVTYLKKQVGSDTAPSREVRREPERGARF